MRGQQNGLEVIKATVTFNVASSAIAIQAMADKHKALLLH